MYEDEPGELRPSYARGRPKTNPADNLPALVDRAFQGEHFALRAGGEIKAVLMGINEYNDMLATIKAASEEAP